jgi:hypothetical protein
MKDTDVPPASAKRITKEDRISQKNWHTDSELNSETVYCIQTYIKAKLWMK